MTPGSPSAFSWIALSTSDPDGAAAFYGRLFGWTQVAAVVGSVLTNRAGHPVGTLVAHSENTFARREPANWFPLVRVDDADAAAQRVLDAGGRVWVKPYSMGVARIAIVRGATGEAFGLWETPIDGGEPLVNDSSCVAWFELATREPERAIAFYQAVFGWRIADEGGYTYIGNESGQFGGIVKLEGDWEDHAFLKAIGRARGAKLDVPPHWMVFFAVDDCDAFSDDAEALGGLVTQRPDMLHTVGNFAVVKDPQGVYFSVLSKR